MNPVICFIINKPAIGGAELFLLRLSKYLSPQFECHIIFLFPDGEMLDKFRDSGCVIHTLYFSKLISLPANFIKLIKLLRVIKPDVVHTWLYISDLIGGVAAKIAGVKKIYWSIRQSNIRYRQNKFHTYILIRLCGLMTRFIPDKIISCATVAADIHIKHAFYKASLIKVIPNGFKTNELKFTDQARLLFRNKLTSQADLSLVGIIGRVDIQKGFDNFFAIAEIIFKKNPATRFILAGPGCVSTNPIIQDYINEYKLSGACFLLGPQNEDEVRQMLCGLDVLVIPSRGEAFPNILGEAMCIGTPVITTNVGEIPIILEGIQNCFEPGDNLGMAEWVIHFITKTDIEKTDISTKLRNRIVSRYDFDLVMKMFKEEYTS